MNARSLLLLAGVSRQGGTSVTALAHVRIFGIVVRGRHRDVGYTAGILAVLEAKGVA
jgi:hypothetical protein